MSKNPKRVQRQAQRRARQEVRQRRRAFRKANRRKYTAGGAKPDYLDLDGDGNKTEPMKSAAKKKMMGGDYMQESNEIKFGGPTKKQRGGESTADPRRAPDYRTSANSGRGKSAREKKQNTPQGTGGGAKSRMDSIAAGGTKSIGAKKVKAKSNVSKKLSELSKAPSKRTGDDRSFSQAFSDARKAGKTTFTWRGKKYGTKTKEEASRMKPMSTINKKSAKAIGIETSKDLKTAPPLKSTANASKSESKTKSTRADRIKARGEKKAGKITARANKKAAKSTRRSNIKTAKAEAKKMIRAAKGKPEKKFIGGLVGAVRGFRKNKGKGLGARMRGAAAGVAGGSVLGRAAGAIKGFRGAKGQGLKGRIKGAASGALRGSGDEIQAGAERVGRGAKRAVRRAGRFAGRMAKKGIGMAKDAASVALGGQDELQYGGPTNRKKKVNKKLFGGRAARQERRENRQERRAARQDARQEARAQGAGFFGSIGAGMQAGRDMRQQQQQEAMGQQAQPQQPPMDQAPAPAPAPAAPMAPPPLMDKGVVQGQAPTKTIDGAGDEFSTAGSLRYGGPTKKFFGGKAKARREDRRERRDVRKAQKAADKAELEGLSGREKRQARRQNRKERRVSNRLMRQEQRAERTQARLDELQGNTMAPEEQQGETSPAMTGSMAGGIDLRANKVGLDTGGGAAQTGGFRDRRKVRKAKRKYAKSVKKHSKQVSKMQRQAQRKNRRMQRK